MTVKRYRVAGRVQGVGFRAFVARRAGALEIDGWVRNLDDGTVEALVEATRDVHREFERILREGPRFSEVQLVLATDEVDPAPVGAGFIIARDGPS